MIRRDQAHSTEVKMRKEKIGMSSRLKPSEVSCSFRSQYEDKLINSADDRRKEPGGDDSDDGGKKKKRR